MSVYKYEHSAGEFVEAFYEAESLRFISDIITVYTNAYYVPDANFSHPPQPWDIAGEEELWLEMNRLVDKFTDSTGTTIFILTERFGQPYRSILVIDRASLEWIEFMSRISNRDMIYNNNHAQIYINEMSEEE